MSPQRNLSAKDKQNVRSIVCVSLVSERLEEDPEIDRLNYDIL